MPAQSDLIALQKWMEEYVLDKRLGEEPSGGPLVQSDLDFSGEPPPADNQIRLWPSVREEDPPLYGLVKESGYDQWMELPFSPYAFPALPEELRVREEPPARVVQGWNFRAVTGARVAASWMVAMIPEAYALLLERWWMCVQAGEMPREGFGEAVGPVLRHPLDPRHGYLDAERIRVDQILGETPAVYADQELGKAAEPNEDGSYGESEETGQGDDPQPS
jgi:hypothetical protein